MSSPSRLLCQYEDGPPVAVITTHRNIAIDMWTVEDSIASHVRPDTEEEPSFQMRLRSDAHLLDCRRPLVPLETILGVWEDSFTEENVSCSMDENNLLLQDEVLPLRNPVLNVTVTGCSTEGSMFSSCSCQAPHSEWKREPFLKENDHAVSNTLLPSTTMHWVDLRRTNQLSLETPAACCHFLRSLLGTSHNASPWVNPSRDEPNLPSVVALLVRSEVASTLAQFRTGDACPSYFLHATMHLQLPTRAPVLWWQETNALLFDPPLGKMNDICYATLLVYRTMPSRVRVMVHRPPQVVMESSSDDNEQPLADGCLWEVYTKHVEVDEQDNDPAGEPEGDDIDDELVEIHYRGVSPPYVSHQQDYANLLEPLLAHLSTIRKEAMSIPQWTAWPERQHYRSSSSSTEDEQAASWTVFPLCHCFPAHCVANRKWLDATCAHVPQTKALLEQYLGDTLRTALFSRLDAETTLEAHTGWQDLANHVFRVHLPLVVPPGGFCGTWVDGCVETHEVGRPLCFDDSKVHRAFNYSQQERVVLILDLARPDYLPVGTATGGHTEELDKFIDQLT